jgi:hypothetical protein
MDVINMAEDVPKVTVKGAMEQYVLGYALTNGRLPQGGAFVIPSTYAYEFDLPNPGLEGAIGGKLAQRFVGMQLNLKDLANYGAKMYDAGELDKDDEDINDRAPSPKRREHVWDAAMYA